MQAYQEPLMSGVKRDAESLSGFGQITHHDTLSSLVFKRTVVGDTDNKKKKKQGRTSWKDTLQN